MIDIERARWLMRPRGRLYIRCRIADARTQIELCAYAALAGCGMVAAIIELLSP